MPALLGGTDAAGLVRDLADEIAEFGEVLAQKERLNRSAARLPATAAYAGRRLSDVEMNALLRGMEATPLAGSNHGRPTYVELNSPISSAPPGGARARCALPARYFVLFRRSSAARCAVAARKPCPRRAERRAGDLRRAMQHIMARHGPDGTAPGAGKYAKGTTGDTIRALVAEALRSTPPARTAISPRHALRLRLPAHHRHHHRRRPDQPYRVVVAAALARVITAIRGEPGHRHGAVSGPVAAPPHIDDRLVAQEASRGAMRRSSTEMKPDGGSMPLLAATR